MSEEQAVLVERRDRVMIITLNRPEAMNAINGALSNGLLNAVKVVDILHIAQADIFTRTQVILHKILRWQKKH